VTLRRLEEGGVVKKRDFRKEFLRVVKFDDAAKSVALEMFAKTGRISDAAMIAGVSSSTIREHLNRDPDFLAAWEIAREQYCDHVTALVEKRGFEGIEEPILGGKYKDQVVAHKRVFSDSLAMMHAKRYVPEYREKQQLDMTVTGGVLAVASSFTNTKGGLRDWKHEYGGNYEPGSIQPEPPPAIPNREVEDVRSVEGSGELSSGDGTAVPGERAADAESSDGPAVG